MIHCALLGSIERFLSVYIEHTAGHFPFWVAPEQVRIVTVNEKTEDYVGEITAVLDGIVLMKPLKYNEVRYTVDRRKESIGKKIREAEIAKVPLTIIVGPKDMEARQVSVRTQEGEAKIDLPSLETYVKGF
jgi:threonyl-tRNA synthetase